MEEDEIVHLGYRPCGLPCPRGMHPCELVENHNGPCPPCMLTVGKESDCPHRTLFFCHELGEDEEIPTDCRQILERARPCGHVVLAICSDPSTWIEELPCDVLVLKPRKCGHPMVGLCSEDLPEEFACEVVVAGDRGCGHPGPVYCHEGVGIPPTYPCRERCLKKCLRGHECPEKCGETCPQCPILIQENKFCSTGQHKRLIPCGTVKPSEELNECPDLCKAPLPSCDHGCLKLCHAESIVHGPCQVSRLVPICENGHTVEMTCEEERVHQKKPPQEKQCEALVPYSFAATPCGHEIRIPCHLHIFPLSTPYLVQLCKVPCDTILECGHPCVGNCAECHQGRFHVACAEPCGKPLICGHTCTSPCSANCPPCPKKCKRTCPTHGPCTQMCGFPCRPCRQKITQCELNCHHHTKCQREFCSDPCTVPVCTLPCRKKHRKCGHPCISVCGEKCQQQICRVCHAERLLGGIFDGSAEVEATHMFVLLSCGHFIEVESLRQHLEAEAEDREIFRKSCPLCRSPIWYCQRFHDLIRKNDTDMRAAIAAVFGSDDQVMLTAEAYKIFRQWCLRQDKPPYESRTQPQFVNYDGMYRALVSRIVDLNQGRVNRKIAMHGFDNCIPLGTINLVKATIKWMLQMEASLYKYHQLNVGEAKRLRGVVDETLGWLNSQRFPLKPQGMLDLNRAMQRATDVESILLRMVTYPKDGRPRVFESTSAEGREAFKNTFQVVLAYEPYTQGVRDMFLANRLKLDDELGHGLGVTVEETRQIVTAIGGPAGRWFKCRNGHPFLITECGGAMEIGECMECKVPIGGENHVVLQGVTLATEMDGAVRPAWPTALNNARRAAEADAGAQAEGAVGGAAA